MDAMNTRVSLFDIYPEFEIMKLQKEAEQALTPMSSQPKNGINWGLILFIAAAGVGVYYAVKWREEERRVDTSR
jgi:hypothetical protein